ncbi:MAG: DUF1549 domain-containing protein [Verrucomicrobia bacterium]|nr:MAG: DUF1549 domain-containing protein [Verrucomicrobiota bacterium]
MMPRHAVSPPGLPRWRVPWPLLLASVFALGSLRTRAGADVAFSADALEFFERGVRPVLVERCHSCHSHRSEKLKGNLYLDSRAGALKGGETGPAVVPGSLEKSLLIAAIARTNADLAMPPKTALSEPERDVLRRWVAMGAPWPTEAPPARTAAGFDLGKRKEAHWCWRPIANPPVPAVRHAEGVRSPIDAFVLARLESAGLKAAPPADRRTLIRRATFDLTGLPPKPEEVEAFVADPSPDAFEGVVDRLLASPHFGERWARHWMDLVRYAESRGHEFDPDIPNAWRYRDYLVRAFNEDVPYDQFVREHLAGDLIPPRVRRGSDANESILGTGFWFLGEEVHSPVDIRQDEADRIDNRLDVMGKTFLGLTLGCARCHDHKFDAISQRDYYGLTGFLVSSSYRQARFESLEWNGRIAAELDAVRDADTRAVGRAVAVALRTGVAGAAPSLLAGAVPEPVPAAVVADVVVDFARSGPADWMQDGFAFGLRPARAGDLLFGPDARHPILGVAEYGAAIRDPLWRGLKTEGGSRDAGRLGNWDRSEQTLKTREIRLAADSLWYFVKGAGRAYAVVDSHQMVNGPLHGALFAEWKAPEGGWGWVRHSLGDYRGHRLHVEFSPAGDADLAIARVVQSEERPGGAPPAAAPVAPDPVASAARVRPILLAVLDAWAAGNPPSTPRDLAAANWLAEHFDALCPADGPARARFDAVVAPVFGRRSALAARIRKVSASAPAMFDGSGIDEFVLSRGSPRKPGEPAPRRFLEAISGPEPMRIARGAGRLELAEAVLAPGNPLAARVMANRAWQHLFGRGLVATVDNFGVLGQAPSHPELLDHLAHRFRGPLGWSLKSLLREMMLSDAYRMASRTDDPQAERTDPENQLLHRANLRRLDAESIRDAILSVSGGLDARLGGPSIPVHLTPFMEGRGRPGSSGPLSGAGRRSVYQEVRRNFLSPLMLAFDAPIPFNAVGRRNVSNVPAQALALMNDPFVVGQAAQWARALPREPSGARIRRLYETAFGRLPTEAETSRMDAFAREQARRLGVGDPSDPRVWADVCHVVFNAKEFIYLD